MRILVGAACAYFTFLGLFCKSGRYYPLLSVIARYYPFFFLWGAIILFGHHSQVHRQVMVLLLRGRLFRQGLKIKILSYLVDKSNSDDNIFKGKWGKWSQVRVLEISLLMLVGLFLVFRYHVFGLNLFSAPLSHGHTSSSSQFAKNGEKIRL